MHTTDLTNKILIKFYIYYTENILTTQTYKKIRNGCVVIPNSKLPSCNHVRHAKHF